MMSRVCALFVAIISFAPAAAQTARPPKPTPTFKNEDCVPYDPASVRFERHGASTFVVTDGESQIGVFDNEEDATNALAVAQRHTAHCFIGRGRSAEAIDYWRGTYSINRSLSRETCASYSPASLKTSSTRSDGWTVTDGAEFVLRVANRDDANALLSVAKHFRAHCTIGAASQPSTTRLQYWTGGDDLAAPAPIETPAPTSDLAVLTQEENDLLVAVANRALKDGSWTDGIFHRDRDSPRCVEYASDSEGLRIYPLPSLLVNRLRRIQPGLTNCAEDDTDIYDRFTLGPVRWNTPSKYAYVYYGPYGGINGRASFQVHRGRFGRWILTPMIRE